MKLNFVGTYNKEEIKYITKIVESLDLPENDEYLYVGEITFIAIKKDEVITIKTIKNVL